mmetsp:Transcript_17920/g.42661  ORF Transcript_17920/g.42661 Transcript_17920/m.42661 type:complete len:227 (-) Transcript_17920:41-721(-)
MTSCSDGAAELGAACVARAHGATGAGLAGSAGAGAGAGAGVGTGAETVAAMGPGAVAAQCEGSLATFHWPLAVAGPVGTAVAHPDTSEPHAGVGPDCSPTIPSEGGATAEVGGGPEPITPTDGRAEPMGAMREETAGSTLGSTPGFGGPIGFGLEGYGCWTGIGAPTGPTRPANMPGGAPMPGGHMPAGGGCCMAWNACCCIACKLCAWSRCCTSSCPRMYNGIWS